MVASRRGFALWIVLMVLGSVSLGILAVSGLAFIPQGKADKQAEMSIHESVLISSQDVIRAYGGVPQLRTITNFCAEKLGQAPDQLWTKNRQLWINTDSNWVRSPTASAALFDPLDSNQQSLHADNTAWPANTFFGSLPKRTPKLRLLAITKLVGPLNAKPSSQTVLDSIWNQASTLNAQWKSSDSILVSRRDLSSFFVRIIANQGSSGSTRSLVQIGEGPKKYRTSIGAETAYVLQGTLIRVYDSTSNTPTLKGAITAQSSLILSTPTPGIWQW